MNSFTGRRSNDRAKRIGRGLLEGLSALGTVMADGPKKVRIQEIDRMVEDLLQERDHLIADLIEPGDLKVSENYNPRWRKPVVEDEDEDRDYIFGDKQPHGRLTECKGRSTMGSYHEAHPACPYIGQRHNAHEFTLRD